MRQKSNSLESEIFSRINEKHLVFAVLTLAFILRIIGIGYGLPFNYHADEQLEINQTMGFGTGDLNPHFFKLPPLVTYLLFPFYGLFYAIGHVLGWFSSPEAFLGYYLKDSTVFYLIARIIFGALLGTLGVFLVFRLARRFFGERTAFAASFLLAVNFLHVRDSHFFYLDLPLLAILTGGMYFVLSVLEEGKPGDYLWCGFFVGLATAMKYNGVWLAVPYLAAHLIRNWKNFINAIFFWPLWLSGVICILSFFAMNPFAVSDWNFFLKEGLGQLSAEGSSGFWHHFVYSLNNGLGWGLTVLSLIGIGLGFFLRNPRIWIFSVWIVSYYLLLAKGSQPHDRYVLPLIPFMILTAAWALDQLRVRGAVFAAIICLVAASNFVKSSLLDYLLLQKDSRTVAREALITRLPTDAEVAIGEPYFFAPRLPRSKSQLGALSSRALDEGVDPVKMKRLMKMAESASEKGFQLYFLNEVPENKSSYFSTRPQIGYNELKKNNISFIVLPRLKRYELKEDARLITRFSPYWDDRVKQALDPAIRTSTPSSWKELLARKSFGEIIDVYEIR